MRYLVFSAVFTALTGASSAEVCPDAPDHSGRLSDLIAEVQETGDEATAREISNQMWALWADAPDEGAQAILDRGMSRRSGYDFAGALTDFDRLID